MPNYPPRREPVKKQEELAKREKDLVLAIKKNAKSGQLIKLMDKYRQAQLSILKAKIHQLKENEFQKKENNIKPGKIEELIVEWTNKTNEDIISEIKKAHDL